MSIDAALVYRLTSTAGVSALVGSRVYAAPAARGAAVPLVTYERISTDIAADSTGDANNDDALYELRCIAATRAGAIAVRDAVRAAVHGVRAAEWGESGSEVYVYRADVSDMRDDFEDEGDADDAPAQMCVLTVAVAYAPQGA